MAGLEGGGGIRSGARQSRKRAGLGWGGAEKGAGRDVQSRERRSERGAVRTRGGGQGEEIEMGWEKAGTPTGQRPINASGGGGGGRNGHEAPRVETVT
jgi:hypothetical protein